MGSFLKHGFLLRILHVYLRAFQNLQRHSAVCIISQERAATRFAHILHHAADAHRTVQLAFQIQHQVGIFQILDVLLAAIQILLHKAYHFLHLLAGIFSAVNETQILECFLLQRHQYARNHLLVCHRITFQTVGHHVVNVLHKHDISVQVIQILNQGAMAARTEHQPSFLITERMILHIGSHRVSAGFLL